MPNWSRTWEQWYRRALVGYWVFLFCATHFPGPKLPGPIPYSDKLAHMLAFGVLAFLFWRCAESSHRKLSGRFVWIAFVTLAGYAGFDEYLQQFVNRYTCWSDWFANLGGIALVLLALELRRRFAHARPAAAGDRQEP